MKKNSLKASGLSLSQAQSISNSCNQHAIELESQLNQVNNFSKTVKVGDETHILQQGRELPSNVLSIVSDLGLLKATQAFLMENIKAKDSLLKQIQLEKYVQTEAPIRGDYAKVNLLEQVGEEFGWSELSENEINEFYDVEAKAAAIGVFIHKNGKLTALRNELPNVPQIEWMEIESGKKTPITIKVHHTPKQLIGIYDSLVEKHRELEQRVNYFKAKVKNLVTNENARIANVNAIELKRVEAINREVGEKFNTDLTEWSALNQKLSNDFEAKRQERVKEVVNLRIDVPAMFQPIVGELPHLNEGLRV